MNLSDDRGSVTAFAVVFALALLICAGLVVDGGAKIQAYREAYAVAEETARAGAGQIDLDRAYAQGGRFEIDTSKALAAARDYLGSGGHSGSVTMVGGRTVHVSVTVSKPTKLVSLVGIGSVTATAKASARMFQGIEQGRP
ncbi:pilus assembly protein TadG-related protein [Planotetraspora kaengkrachanensis]|uniref:Membrane protein n=1 Tax=Planotetraspora kaengkrachanensis TaxID=575193 RepID=A0A8J3LWZ2_9ACTN|nr:pilus assembly protein TadG-related protein [Planotetraspora kaengkrachanensis]GIG79987.1 membrane protein [Planotetraspora kaengkrachanensis]